jgi:light-regulated signal transduction histidine kinase (bacteriophytochrome)
LHPWRDDAGNIGGIIMFTEIITDAKNSKAELLRSNAALEEFAYVVSHDLKAPLRHISMCASFFEESMQSKLDDESKKLLHIMRDSSEKMRVMIESLLDYSRIGRSAGEYKLVDLNSALADALVALTPQIESSGAVVQSDALPSIRGSQTEMTRVFQNFVENAIKYRREGASPVVKVKANKRDNLWEISISDNGIGIDPKFSAKIFQLFQRLHGEDSAYTGAGIGLAVCQRIIHYHGGQVWLDPDYNDGCRFVMTLPDVQSGR